jgi:hypothetical protein
VLLIHEANSRSLSLVEGQFNYIGYFEICEVLQQNEVVAFPDFIYDELGLYGDRQILAAGRDGQRCNGIGLTHNQWFYLAHENDQFIADG